MPLGKVDTLVVSIFQTTKVSGVVLLQGAVHGHILGTLSYPMRVSQGSQSSSSCPSALTLFHRSFSLTARCSVYRIGHYLSFPQASQEWSPCPFFALPMAAGGECAQRPAVKDFVTGDCAEICFSLFPTGIKKTKDTWLCLSSPNSVN